MLSSEKDEMARVSFDWLFTLSALVLASKTPKFSVLNLASVKQEDAAAPWKWLEMSHLMPRGKGMQAGTEPLTAVTTGSCPALHGQPGWPPSSPWCPSLLATAAQDTWRSVGHGCQSRVPGALCMACFKLIAPWKGPSAATAAYGELELCP